MASAKLTPAAPPGILARRPALRYLALGLLLIGMGWAVYSLGWQAWASYHYHAALNASARRDYAETGTHVEKYLLARPWDWEGWILAARTSRQQGNFDLTERFLREAKKQGAPDLDIGLERRLLIVQIGDPAEADQLLAFCAENLEQPEAPLMLEAVADGSLRNHDAARTRKAADLWLKVVRSAPDEAHGHLWLGQADRLDNDAGAAVDHFQKAVDLAPAHPRARLLLASTLVHDQPERARPHLEILRREHPDDPEVLFQTARMHRYLGEVDKANQLLDQVIEADAGNVTVLLEKARLSLELRRPQEAERLLRQAFRRAPDDRQVNVSLADCLRQQGKLDDAKVFGARVDALDKAAQKGANGLAKK